MAMMWLLELFSGKRSSAEMAENANFQTVAL